MEAVRDAVGPEFILSLLPIFMKYKLKMTEDEILSRL